MVMEPGEEGEDDEMAEALAAMAGGEGGLPPGMIAVELTPEDEAAIGRLEALGFERSACIEAYLRWGGCLEGRVLVTLGGVAQR
jgi:UV excision repair protein RAD23